MTTNDQYAGQPQLPTASAKPRKRRMAREPRAIEGSPKDGASGDAKQPAAKTPAAPSKIASVIALLERTEGATLVEMVEVTGWQPHTTRAALTGLKKKGHSIAREKRGDVTCYRIR